MPDLINFTLPTIDEGTDKKTLKQIKNYLFQLTEQMKFYLNNIDADNFNDAYKEKLASMINESTSAAVTATLLVSALNRARENLEKDIETVSNAIINNKGGYLVLLDKNGDSFPDELLILCDSSDYTKAQKLWRFNSAGLAFSKNGYNGDYEAAIVYDKNSDTSYVVAEKISGEKITGVTLEAGAIKGGTIDGVTGAIGGWTIGTWNDENKKPHEGLKKTFTYTDEETGKPYYQTFAIDSTSGSDTEEYILQLFLSDESGNAEEGGYIFALSTRSIMELDTLSVRQIKYRDDSGWCDVPNENFIAYLDDGTTNQNFTKYTVEGTDWELRYRKCGNLMEIRGGVTPISTLSPPYSNTRMFICRLFGINLAQPIYQVCQGSGYNIWNLVILPGEEGIINLYAERYRCDSEFREIPQGAWLNIQTQFFTD